MALAQTPTLRRARPALCASVSVPHRRLLRRERKSDAPAAVVSVGARTAPPAAAAICPTPWVRRSPKGGLPFLRLGEEFPCFADKVPLPERLPGNQTPWRRIRRRHFPGDAAGADTSRTK